MSTPVRLALFAVALAAVFSLALGAGSLLGPVGPAGAADAAAAPAHGEEHGPPTASVVPKGLQTSQDG